MPENTFQTEKLILNLLNDYVNKTSSEESMFQHCTNMNLSSLDFLIY